MGERVSLNGMLIRVRDLRRRPFTEAELNALESATPAIAPKLSAKFDAADGCCYLAAPALHMEFVVVKSAGRLFGLLPRYTVWMGFEHGELWEQGPVVNRLRAVTYTFQRMAVADQWLDAEYGRKK